MLIRPVSRDAWSAQHGLSRTEAKRRYISTLIETMHKYASTTAEARELVAELEFVWDQIKSNSVSSSGSSPGQASGLPGGLQQSRSYTSIIPGGGVGARDDRDGGLRALRPVSDGDEEEIDEEEEMEEARDGEYADDGEMVARSGGDEGKRNYEARNRKWRKRMEQALMRMTTEVAALREQLEAKRFLDRQRRKNLWAWMRWLVWVTIRHLVVSAAIIGLVLIWARRKRDKRVEQGLGLLLEVAAEQARRLQIPRLLRLPRRG